MSRSPGPFSGEEPASDRTLDEMIRAHPFPADVSEECLQRLEGRVMGRLRRRRRKLVASATAAAAAVAVLSGIVFSYLGEDHSPTPEMAHPPRPSLQGPGKREAPNAPSATGAESGAETVPSPEFRMVKDATDAERILERLSHTGGRSFFRLLQELLDSDPSPSRARAIQICAKRYPRRAAALFWKEGREIAAEGDSDPDAGRALRDFIALSLDGMPSGGIRSLVALARSRAELLEAGSRKRSQGREKNPEDAFLIALGRSGRPEVWPLLEARLHARGAVPALIEALGLHGDERAVSILGPYVCLAEPRGRKAVEALGRIPGELSFRRLLSAYQDSASVPVEPWPGFRQAVVAALKRHPERAIVLLRKGCRGQCRTTDLSALVELFPRVAEAELPRLLQEATPRTRPLVCRALAELGTPKAAKILLDALKEPSLRVLARRSLIRIARKDYGPDLRAWSGWYRGFENKEKRRASAGRSTSGTYVASLGITSRS